MNEKLECLKKLYGMGFNVIPIGDKTPLIPFLEWTVRRIDPERLCGWGREFKDCNWGILAGAKPYNDTPGIVCVDCDDVAGHELAKKRCPSTPVMQQTPGGGVHLIYRRPDVPYLPIRSKTRMDGVLYNVDIRADHGYFLAPGSFSVKRGKPYVWTQPWTRKLLEQAPVYDPLWLPHESAPGSRHDRDGAVHEHLDHEEAIEAVETPMPLRRQMAEKFLAKCPGSEQGRGGDNYCFALAMDLLWGFALDAEIAKDLLHDWGRKDSNVDEHGLWYPWDGREISHKIKDALRAVYHGVVGDRLECVMGEFYEQLDELFETRRYE